MRGAFRHRGYYVELNPWADYIFAHDDFGFLCDITQSPACFQLLLFVESDQDI